MLRGVPLSMTKSPVADTKKGAPALIPPHPVPLPEGEGEKLDLSSPVEKLPSVGPIRAKELRAIVWFNQSWVRTKIVPGMNIRVRGRVKIIHNSPQMANPKWEKLEGDEEQLTDEKFRPIYPATAKMPSERIGAIIDRHLDDAV